MTWFRRALAYLGGVGVMLTAAACSSGPPPPPRPVASLGILDVPSTPQLATLPAKQAHVRAGRTFNIVVATSDGPYAWVLTGSGAPAIVSRAGTAPVSSCNEPGCAPPERYTFRARAAGSTTLVFTLFSLRCGLNPKPTQQTCRLDIQEIRLAVG